MHVCVLRGACISIRTTVHIREFCLCARFCALVCERLLVCFLSHGKLTCCVRVWHIGARLLAGVYVASMNKILRVCAVYGAGCMR